MISEIEVGKELYISPLAFACQNDWGQDNEGALTSVV